MQCVSCHAECANLSEHSLSTAVDEFRKTITTIHLCAVCEIIYAIKPAYITARISQFAGNAPERVRAAA